MVGRAALAAILTCSFLSPLAMQAAKATVPFSTLNGEPLGFLIKDGDSTIWGAHSGQDLPIYRQTPVGWDEVRSDAKANRCAKIVVGSDGKLYALLIDDGSQTAIVVRYTKDGATTIGSFQFKEAPTQLLVDADGTAWVTGQSREIRHVLGGGKPDVTYNIPSSEIIQQMGMPVGDNIQTVVPIRDGKGRIWFYSKFGSDTWLPALKELIIWNGRAFNYMSHLLGAPEDKIQSLSFKDKSHFWVIYPTGGLGVIDTDSLNVSRVAGPNGLPMRNIRQIEPDRADWVVVTDPNVPPGSPTGILWRLNVGGKAHNGKLENTDANTPHWSKVIDGLQTAGWYTADGPMPIFSTAAGTWIAVTGTGIWWSPRNGTKPALLDWRRGFHLAGVSTIFELNDHRVIAAQSYRQPVILPESLPPLLPPSSLNFKEEKLRMTTTALQPDSRAHLWGLLLNGSTGLDEWDGAKWISHPLPPKLDRSNILTVAADNSDRIWCFLAPSTPVAIYDQHKGLWESYANLKSAVDAHRREPGFAFRPEWTEAPKILGNKIAAYWDAITYFDGETWHSWQQQNISKTEYVDVMPYFNASGQLSLRGNDHAWTWDGKSWQVSKLPEANAPDQREALRVRVTSELQQIGFSFGNSGDLMNPTAGPHGDWFFVDYQLYHYLDGMARAQFTENQANPYLQWAVIDAVREDAGGRIWLGTYAAASYRFIRLLPPVTKPITLKVTSQTQDTVTINIGGGDKSLLYEWQMDDSPATISGDRSRRFANAIPGGHTISVTPLTSRLIPAATANKLQWTSTIAPHDQIANLILQLGTGTDQDKTSAADTLAQYGNAAVAPLNTARVSATENEQWWIDAILQKIGEQSSLSSTNTKPEVVK